MNKTNNFNTVARYYDLLASLVFGNTIRNSQIELLSHIQEGDKILIIGGGTGWILQEIAKCNKAVEIDYLEASERMIEKARALDLSSQLKINFIPGEEESIQRSYQYDIVMAFYFFDLFKKERQKKIIDLINTSLKLQGKLLVADFSLSETSPVWHKLIMKTMYTFFKITSNVEANELYPFRALLKNKFTHYAQKTFFSGFILSEVYLKDRTEQEQEY